jgi:hypothetical protein
LATAELEWQLDLRWWRSETGPFTLAPRDVLRAPNDHLADYERAMCADLAYPIHVTPRNGASVVVDGTHRVLKAVALEHPTIDAKIVRAALLRELR